CMQRRCLSRPRADTDTQRTRRSTRNGERTESAGTIAITAGRAPREGNEQDYAGPDGTRSAMLIRVADPVTEPSTMGKGGTWTSRIWTFAIDDQSEYDGQILEKRVSDKSSPSSGQYAIL